jgi:hypothetical protein
MQGSSSGAAASTGTIVTCCMGHILLTTVTSTVMPLQHATEHTHKPAQHLHLHGSVGMNWHIAPHQSNMAPA